MKAGHVTSVGATGELREALEKLRIALGNFGDGSLARIAKHFPTGSEEWAIIHDADESMSLACEAARAALAATQEDQG